MQLFRKYRPDIAKKHIFLVAFIFSLVVVLQITTTQASNPLQEVAQDFVLFVSNYILWAFMIDFIYGPVYFARVSHFDRKTVLEGVFSLILLIIIHLVVTNIIYYAYLCSTTSLTIPEVPGAFAPYVIPSFFSRVMDVIIIIFILVVIDTYKALEKQKLQLVSLENQLHRSELKALRAQLDPHFLFNTLHTLNTLVGYDDEKARSMIIKVTGLMRKMLVQRDRHTITLEEELSYIQDYLDIESERFYDRLDVQVEVDAAARSFEVPTLMLQPLVENAFKHGIAQLEGEGRISLTARKKPYGLEVSLTNTVPKDNGRSNVSSTQVGISNLKSRLDQIFGDHYEFSATRANDLFTVNLKINTIV